MKHLNLQGKLRATGKKADVKSVRREERVPCVIYGNGMENVLFSVGAKELAVLTDTPFSHIIDLDIEGNKYLAKLQDIQWHPVTDKAIHVDFIALAEDKPVTISVPVKIVGNSEGVKQGGKLFVSSRKLKVSGLMENLPDELEVDITPMGIGSQIFAKDLHYDNIQIVSPKGTLVCAVRATRASAAAATAAAE
jgi:large subunit ribosomal protein L25